MISICILTKNSARTIRQTLESTLSFPEVLLLDNGSTDGTLEIGKNYPNVKQFSSPFLGFGPLRGKIASLAEHNWILALDSDEILSPPLIHELQNLSPKIGCLYSILRHNFYGKKWIKGCGWHPDRVIRLYNRLETAYCTSSIHESVLKKNLKTIPLQSPIFHTPYLTTFDFLSKMQYYSTLFAEQNKKKRRASFSTAVGHGLFSFFRSYFLKRGFLDGREGFLISLYNGNTSFYKYMKLKELNEQAD